MTNPSNNWRVVAASVCGTSHQKRSQPCQDAHCWQITPEGVLIAAVADGAGSATFGEVGAQIAVRTTVSNLCQADWDSFPDTFNAQKPTETLEPDPESLEPENVRSSHLPKPIFHALESARDAVVMEAQMRQSSVRELASTLIVVVATPQWVVATQVGDGAVVMEEADRAIALTAPQTGEYINETTFLVSPNALETAQFLFWQGSQTHLAILSDGLQMLALEMPTAKPHPPFFSPLFRFISQDDLDATDAQTELENFLTSKRVTQRTDDDITLLLATLK
jgi:serine/threonine protein phosphatase PrpC